MTTSRRTVPRAPLRGLVVAVITSFLAATGALVVDAPAEAAVVNSSDVAPVWSAHETGNPVLLTAGSFQYVAYYDEDLYLTVAQRLLTSSNWTYRTFADVRTNWETGAHHQISMEIDTNNMVHLTGRQHAEPLIYFRMTSSHNLASFTRFPSLVGAQESRVTYPDFLRSATGQLFLTYRDGGSGDGSQIINTYNATTKTWSRTIPSFFDGSGEGAYLRGPKLGPDGWFHLVWMWRRDVPLTTTHDIHYARSTDLVNWRTAGGASVALPIRPTTSSTLIEAVPERGGLLNTTDEIGFDSQDRAVVSYVRYDSTPEQNTQVYNARWTGASWQVVQATNWKYREGLRTITIEPPVVGDRTGTLRADFTHVQYGAGTTVLSEASLKPITTLSGSQLGRFWPESLNAVETVNPTNPMTVTWIDSRGTAPAGTRYVLRWEHGPANRDLPLPGPDPAPTMLRVLKLNATPTFYAPDTVSLGRPVTATSSHETAAWSRTRLTDGDTRIDYGGYASASNLSVDHTEAVTVDLQTPREVNRLVLHSSTSSGYGTPRDFTVQLSANGTTWSAPVVTRTGVAPSAAPRSYLFPPQVTRYVRLTATSLNHSPGVDHRLQLAEMQVQTVANLARGGAVTATSSHETASWSTAFLTDGRTVADATSGTSGYASSSSLGTDHTEAVTVDLGSAKPLHSVSLFPAKSTGIGMPIDFTVAVSTDGSTWTTVVTRNGVTPTGTPNQTYEFSPRTAQYVRLTATSLRPGGGDHRLQLAELQVH